jgi:hypothetical protein
MRKNSSLAVVASLVALGFIVWATSTKNGGMAPSINHAIDPHEFMTNAKGLATARIDDHAFVFP